MASAQKRGPARPVERYWRGKPVAGAQQPSNSDSEDDEAARTDLKPKLSAADIAKRDGITILSTGTLTAPVVPLKKGGLAKSESGSASDYEDEEDVKPIRREGRPLSPPHEGLPKAIPAVKKESESSSEYESSSEEESSEEEAAKPMYKPVFVSKRNRDPKVVAASMANEDPEEAEMKRQERLEEERRQAHQLVGDTIKRSLAEKEVSEKFPDVDDTDGLDGTEEFESWKLRELQRIKRDADLIRARKDEEAEVAKRRAMPEALRLKEDIDHANATRNKERAQQSFLSKYHHRGAFTAHLADGDDILNRVYEAGTEDAVRDMASMPKMMQVRDYGKRSRTKHTHLKDVDTTKDDAGWGRNALKTQKPVGYGKQSTDETGLPLLSEGCFNCGEMGHLKRDCPNPPKGRDGMRPANGNSKGKERERDQGWASHNDVREPRGAYRRSRSRSPRRYDRDEDHRQGARGRTRRNNSRSRSRSRDRSLERMRAERDKRRRVD